VGDRARVRHLRGAPRDPDVDAVYISLPNTLHREWSIRSLEAGKHVICEKPFSKRPSDVEDSFDAADRAGRLLTEAFMYRHNPQTAKLVELVRDGAIGDLRVVRTAFSYSLYDTDKHPPADGRRGREPDGRRLLLRQRVAAPRRRAGVGLRAGVHRPQRHGLGVHRRDALLRGRPRALRLRDVPPRRDELEAIGTEGRSSSTTPGTAWSPSSSCGADDGVEDIRLDPTDSYRLELENLADAIAGDAPLLLGRDDALGQARAIEALFRSAETGAPTGL
jgi:predicted dehydrogenase